MALMEDNIFNNDILLMKSLIGTTIQVTTTDNQTHQGIVYVIDPVYKTVVLADEDNSGFVLILYHSITGYEVVNHTIRQEFLAVNNDCEAESEDNLLKRRDKLIKWFKHMFINVEERDGSLVVEQHVTIEAPYREEDCFCDNTIVMQKIRNIMNLMPVDFE